MLRCLVLSMLALCGVALGNDALEAAADEVLIAARANDARKLAQLAEGEPGAWLLAHELCARGEPDAALSLARAAAGNDFAKLPAYIASRRDRGDDAKARAALKAAQKHLAQGQPDACLAAIDGVTFQGNSVVEVHLESLRAHALAQLRRNNEIGPAFERAGAAAQDLGDLRAAKEAFDNGGGAAYSLKRFATARARWSRRLEIERLRADLRGEADAINNVAATYKGFTEVEPRVLLFERALVLREQLGDTDEVPAAAARLAIAYARVGNYHKALQAADKAVETAKALAPDDLKRRAFVLSSVGSVYMSMDNGEKALEYQLRHLELRERQKNAFGTALAQVTVAQCYERMKDYEKAGSYFERAARFFEQAKSLWLAYCLQMLGKISEHKKDYERAFAHHRRAMEVAERHGDRRLMVQSLLGFGGAHLSAEKYEEALPILEQGVAAAEQLGHFEMRLRAHWAKALCLTGLERYAEALEEVQPTIEIINQTYQGLGGEEGAQARAQYARVFNLGSSAAGKLNDAPKTFFYLETGRAGGLLEALGGRAQLRSAAIPEGLREEEALVRKAMDTARARHQEAVQVKDLKQARSRKKELDVAQEKMRDVIQKIQRDAKASAGLLYPSPVALAELQGTLAKDEVLVSYAVFSRKAMALVITAGTARVVQLGEREAIVDACDALVLDDTEEDPSGRIEQLRELLIKPLALEAGVKRILISPDGPLSYIPFSMLVGTRAVAYVPSGTTLALLRGERHERGKKVLALGDPVYTGELERLPETRTEAKAVGDVVLLGEDATKAGLETALAKRKRWRAVHLACHGLIDRERPTLSSLAITGGNLTAFDVMRMNFAADLVVLSACETGKGKIVRGEGLIGLTRAFMLAGTPRVIVSLWPVEDKATQALMKKFFQLWKRGAPAASALMKAQAHVRSKKKWKHPSYWAAWQLWGLPE